MTPLMSRCFYHSLPVDANVTKGSNFGICDNTTLLKDGKLHSNQANTYYDNSCVMQNEIGMVKTLLHEAIHAKNALDGILNPDNHDGFDRATLLAGLKEHNETHSLGYSESDLEIISWSGLTKSKEFDSYLQERSNKSGNSKDQEFRNWKIEITKLIYIEE